MLISRMSKDFSFIGNIHVVLIEILSLYGVLSCFFNDDVDYYISPDMLLLNTEI